MFSDGLIQWVFTEHWLCAKFWFNTWDTAGKSLLSWSLPSSWRDRLQTNKWRRQFPLMARAMKTRHRACPEMVGGIGMPLWAERITDCEGCSSRSRCCYKLLLAYNCFLSWSYFFWNPLTGGDERVWTFVYLLICTAKISSKSMETKCGVPSHICETTCFSATSLAVPPFTPRVSPEGLTE